MQCRWTFWVLALAIVATAGVTACNENVPVVVGGGPDTTVRSVTISPASDTVTVLAKVTLVASVDAPASTTDRTVTWSSSDTTVAKVDNSGVVTGVAVGKANIIAASNANPQVSGAAVVTVAPAA